MQQKLNAQPNQQEKNPNWETKIFSSNNSRVKGRLKTAVAEYIDSNPKHKEGCSGNGAQRADPAPHSATTWTEAFGFEVRKPEQKRQLRQRGTEQGQKPRSCIQKREQQSWQTNVKAIS